MLLPLLASLAALATPPTALDAGVDAIDDDWVVVDPELDEAAPHGVVSGQETDAFEQVVALGSFSGSQGQVFCSGTLIHNRWILTAAHCIDAAEQQEGWGYTTYALFGGNLYQDGYTDRIRIDELHMHPAYDPNQFSHDIGLARLATAKTDVAPMAVNDEPVTGAWQGSDLQMVGFGVTWDNGNDSGVKRTVTLSVTQFDMQYIYSTDLDGNANVCSGDSGGAALEPVNGGYELVGVNAFVTPGCANGSNGATRVDAHLGFIETYVPVLDYDADPGSGTTNTGAPTGDETGPDPATLPADDEPDAAWDPDPPFTPTGDEYSEAVGCASVPTPTTSAAWLGLALLGLRRRR